MTKLLQYIFNGLINKNAWSKNRTGNVWARPNMKVFMRAELMPGRGRSERVCRIERVMPNKRVTLRGFAGEHVKSEFEF